jgi:hypothetical protein
MDYPSLTPGLKVDSKLLAHIPERELMDESPVYGPIVSVKGVRGGAVKVVRQEGDDDPEVVYFYRQFEIQTKDEGPDPYTGKGGHTHRWCIRYVKGWAEFESLKDAIRAVDRLVEAKRVADEAAAVNEILK